MRELSLFTGAGGGLLGSRLLGWRTIGAVEIDKYCCNVLATRQKEGHLAEFPIWNMDIRDFNREVAPRYAGMVDVVSAGFPCQPFSTTGKQRGLDDPRNMWPATLDAIRIIRPKQCLLENVRGLLSQRHGYFKTILKDLADSGYDARWRLLSAAEIGAPHKRDRLWIVANSNSNEQLQQFDKCHMAWSSPLREWGKTKYRSSSVFTASWPPRPCRINDIPRESNGLAKKVDRTKMIGNGQVPAVVKAAWELLSGF